MKWSWASIKETAGKAWRGVCITLGSIGLIVGVYFSIPQDKTIPNPPVYTIGSNGIWTLQQDYTIAVSDLVWTVKAGFDSWDGLSVPDDTTNALKVSRYDYPDASLFHDLAYSMIAVDGTGPISQEKADACLRLILLRDKCATNRADLVEKMVSAWGFSAIMWHDSNSVARARAMVTVQAR